MPLRRKLDILVAAPLLIILALIAPVAYGYFHTARQWNTAANQMNQSEQVYVLINAIEVEQTVAVGLQGGPRCRTAGRHGADPQELRREHRPGAGRRAPRAKPATSSALGQAIAEVVWETQGVSGARATAFQPAADKSAAVETGYGTAIQELYNALDMDVLAEDGGPAAGVMGELGSVYDADMREHNREIDLQAMTNEADLDQQDGGAVLDWPDLSAAERDYGVSLNEAEHFEGVASSTDQNLFQGAIASLAQSYLNSEQQNIEEQLSSAAPAAAVDQVLMADQLGMPDLVGLNSTTGLLQASVQSTQNRAAMEQKVSADVIGVARHQGSTEQWLGLGLVAAAWLVLISLVVLEYRVRRSVVNPMLQLTDGGHQDRRGHRGRPGAGRGRGRPGEDPQAVPVFETVPVLTADEIGELAEAFNWVQDSAVRVLERQIAMPPQHRRDVRQRRTPDPQPDRPSARADRRGRARGDRPGLSGAALPDRPHRGAPAARRGQPDAAVRRDASRCSATPRCG